MPRAALELTGIGPPPFLWPYPLAPRCWAATRRRFETRAAISTRRCARPAAPISRAADRRLGREEHPAPTAKARHRKSRDARLRRSLVLYADCSPTPERTRAPRRTRFGGCTVLASRDRPAEAARAGAKRPAGP